MLLNSPILRACFFVSKFYTNFASFQLYFKISTLIRFWVQKFQPWFSNLDLISIWKFLMIVLRFWFLARGTSFNSTILHSIWGFHLYFLGFIWILSFYFDIEMYFLIWRILLSFLTIIQKCILTSMFEQFYQIFLQY